MNVDLNAAFSFSVVIGAVIGLVRIKKISSSFIPFVILLWAAFTSEATSYLLIKNGYSNAIVYNIYALAEALLIGWQFRRWGSFNGRPLAYYGLQAFFTGAWCYESFFLSTITVFNSYYIIASSFILVFLCLHTIAQMLFFESYQLLRNAKFLICTSFIIFFVYGMIVEIFWICGLSYSDFFRNGIYAILAYVNLFTNLIFALAALWTPMKFRYIMQFS